MQLPDEWDQRQLIIDICATLSCATEYELARLFGNKSPEQTAQQSETQTSNKSDIYESIYRRFNSNNQLGILWTHLHASAFLVMSFAIIEGKMGKKSWKRNQSLSKCQKDEFEVLYCIRNALVHKNGHLRNLDNRTCFDRVSKYERKMKEDKSWRYSLSIVEPYYYLNDDDVVLKQPAFDHILNVMLRLIQSHAG